MGRAKDHEQQMLLSDICAVEKQHREGPQNRTVHQTCLTRLAGRLNRKQCTLLKLTS